jgi:hypothetical protein
MFAQPAPEVWKIVRDFNNYPVWVGGAGESRIEDGKTGDTVGAIRNVQYQGRRIRQRLLAHSDLERSQTYEFCGAASLPVTGFQATLRITPIVDGDRAFVEWWRRSTARHLAATNWPARFGAGSANGWNRCGRRWRTAKARSKTPLMPQQPQIRAHFRKISG